MSSNANTAILISLACGKFKRTIAKKRPEKIVSESIRPNEVFVPPHYPKSEETFQFLDSACSRSFILDSLSSEERSDLIHAMYEEIVPIGTGIIHQGDKGDFFYVVEKGEVEFNIDGKDSGRCGPGEIFGELALLYDCPRAASCIAWTNCSLWKVDGHTFRSILAKHDLADLEGVYNVLKKVPHLRDLDKSALIKCIDAFTPVKFSEGEQILSKDRALHIIREGTVKGHNIGRKGGTKQYVDFTLGPGDFFGEQALSHEPLRTNFTATSECATLSLSRDGFEKHLGPLQDSIYCIVNKNILMSIPIFANSNLDSAVIGSLVDLFEEEIFAEGEFLIKEGDPVTKQGLYFIQNGSVVITTDSGIINDLTRGDYFGESFLQVEAGSISKETIKVAKNATFAVLSKSSIESVIGEVSYLGKPLPSLSKLDNSIKLEDLSIHRIIGAGKVSIVRLVSHRRSYKPYALKIISKELAIQEENIERWIRAKNILASIHHPLIMNLISTFQDDYNLYMLLDFVQGGELFSIIHKSNGIPMDNARFYAACILKSLSYIHRHNICHRNLVPEDILIDRAGYCILTNFMLAKIVVEKTYTFCGTPEYLSPEMILCKGHNKGVDYWSFGVVIYEMLMGVNPFYTSNMDQVTLFKRIVKAKFSFWRGRHCESTENLIQGLLARKQTNRLGCQAKGDIDIRKHDWFKNVDFRRLLRKKLRAPWLPKIKGDSDPSNFETYDHLEDNTQKMQQLLSPDLQERFRGF